MAIRIKSRHGESVAQMLRRFKKLCEKEGLTKEIKRRQYYEKPSERKRRDARRSVVRVVRPGGDSGPMSRMGSGPSRNGPSRGGPSRGGGGRTGGRTGGGRSGGRTGGGRAGGGRSSGGRSTGPRRSPSY